VVPDSTGIALIGLSGTAVVAGVGFLGTIVVEKRRALSESQKALARYSEPLIGAAYELQGRLWNILNNTFLERYVTDGDEAQKAYAVDNTLYVFAQYFGWSEILRRDIQFLSFSKTEQTRNVAKTQYEIVQDFQDDRPELGRPFLLWRGEQRAIGELMIEEAPGGPRCIGYAAFVERRRQTPGDASFRTWLGRLEKDIESASSAKSPRLPELQNHLVDLIVLLDPGGLRFDATDPKVLARSDRGAGAAA
jgi:hypothetical protein